MPLLYFPDESRMRAFLAAEKGRPFSYRETGRTALDTPVPGYNNDLNFIDLGRGEAVWQAGKEAIRQWKMFPGGWARIFPAIPPIQEGETVAMIARVLGFWWLNSCRIVYVLDNARQFGFAYGTLPAHVEQGEEIFMVEKLPDGTVRYVIKAFSRPRHWLARLGYPLARAHQRKFVRDSKRSVAQFVQKQLEENDRTKVYRT